MSNRDLTQSAISKGWITPQEPVAPKRKYGKPMRRNYRKRRSPNRVHSAVNSDDSVNNKISDSAT